MIGAKKATLSQVAEAWIMLDGEPFRLSNWPMHREFYDGRYRRTLFKTARQVAKSTTLANFSIIECSAFKHFSTMFVSPTKEQTTRFSNTRVGKTMRYSPLINKRFLRTDLADRVFHKQFTNGSEMLFTYGSESADRLRGPSTDRNMFDEVQDMLYDPIITVGNETMSQSKYAYETYAGTPKTMENTIQYLWELSTQTEWVMKCPGCSKLVYLDNEKCMGKHGPVCVGCGAYLNPFDGAWVDLCPDRSLKGFHISQPIMPENVPLAMKHLGNKYYERAKDRWQRIVTKFEENPLSVFRNEVLGVSDEIGSRLISLEELLALCSENEFITSPNAQALAARHISRTVAGIDWSGGGTSGVSRTVLWIWGWNSKAGKLECIFYAVYPGTNPANIHDEIARLCAAYQVSMVVGDAGEGALANDLLKKVLTPHRVTQVQYGAYNQALHFNMKDRYLGDRTTLIDNYCMMLKEKKVIFSTVRNMKEAIDDILNEYEEVTTSDRKVWRHAPQKPDDCLHAGIFGWVAWKIINQDLRFYQ